MQTENKYNSFLITNARRGYFNDVRKALDNGADVNVVDDEGNTALICSTMLGLDETINDDENEDYLEVIKLLLLYNVDISKQNNEKYTAMSFACIYNNPKMVKLLLERWDWLSDHNIHMDMCKKDNDIKTGITLGCEFFVEPERSFAIQMAIQKANKNDLVLIAGKGHEDYQEINEKKYPFDDKLVVNRILNLMKI